MADAILDIKLNNIEYTVKEHGERLDEVDNRLDTHSSELDRVRRWAIDGNGDSAESRLKNNCLEISELREQVLRVASDENIHRIAAAAAKSIVTNARDKDRTWVAKVGAVAKVLTPLGAIIAGLAALVAVLLK